MAPVVQLCQMPAARARRRWPARAKTPPGFCRRVVFEAELALEGVEDGLDPQTDAGKSTVPDRFVLPVRPDQIRDNLLARIIEGEREGWLGELEGLEVSLARAQDKLAQLNAEQTRRSIAAPGPPGRPGTVARRRHRAPGRRLRLGQDPHCALRTRPARPHRAQRREGAHPGQSALARGTYPRLAERLLPARPLLRGAPPSSTHSSTSPTQSSPCAVSSGGHGRLTAGTNARATDHDRTRIRATSTRRAPQAVRPLPQTTPAVVQQQSAGDPPGRQRDPHCWERL